jgi:glycerophosphoryl diester phosphodiesterase
LKRTPRQLWRHPDRPIVLGHRGARQRAPENTLAAFDLAALEGADGVELDVRLNGSREVIVLHDRTLGRVTGGEDRDVETVTTRDLAAISLADGERVPLLSDVLHWAVQRDVRVNIELKPDVSRRDLLVRRVAALSQRVPGAPARLVLSSLDPSVLARLRRFAPELPLAWVIAPPLQKYWREPLWPGLGIVGAHPHLSLVDEARVATVHRRGAVLNVWTVNDVGAAQQLAAWGVDGIITDDPAAIAEAVK